MESQTNQHLIDDGIISLPRVTSRILAILIEFFRKHVEASKREEKATVGDDDHETWEELFDLIRFVADGSEDNTLLLQTCLDKVTGGDIPHLQLRLDLLSAFFKYILGRPNFCTIFCQALHCTTMSDRFLEYVSNTLNLSLAEKISVGLALFDSDSMDLRMRGQNLCIPLIEDLIANPTTPAVSHEEIQDIILFLYRSGGLSKHVDYFTKLLSLVPPSESFVFTQSPILTDDESDSLRQLDLFYEGSDDDFQSVLAEIEKEMSVAEIVKELGYGCTVSTSHCKEILSCFLPLHESTLAKLLGKIACTHIGLDDTQSTYMSFCSAVGSNLTCQSSLPSSWNIDVLVNSIKQIAPETNWTRVMENLDHEGFNIPDKASFYLLMSIYSKACGDPFPIHAICGSAWNNAEGQISFLKHAVVAPPDVFTFAHSSRQLANTVMTHLPKGSGYHAWSCLDLLDVLCQLAERGHINSIRSMLELPLKDCPEVLLVGISHVKTAYNLLQYEVLSTIFPVILNDSMKTSVIHHLWEVNANLVLQGFIDTHTDPNSLLKIMDFCLEMKILSSILDASPFIVSLRLAACAYRKDLTNLEKWLNENLTLFKDAFFEGCVAFLKEILSDVKNDAPENAQQSRLSLLNAYQETFPTFFKVLQSYSGQLTSRELFDEFKRLHDFSHSKFQRPTAAALSISDGSPDDIEAEANTYFHQMFSGLLTIDAMVHMLARFKESSEKREQLIFECMIANLFEEYKFFPKYPDRQLKLAAILFGSLIKNQLVTHLALGIALRGVLDALRKSVDSKMFMFGTKALEQFIDRLVEWPQYCNHILQISHLRTSHAELVSVIERALARISSSQADSNGGNSPPADQQQGCSQVSVESMEASDASWQFMGSSSSSQLGQQLSPFQPQQKHQGFLGDRLKQNALSISNINLISSAGQSSLVSTPVDSVINPKPNSQSLQTPPSQLSTGVAATISSSPGFLRPSRSITPAGMPLLRQPSYSIGFGAALNIETLVAAAERRDTPIEAPASEVQDKILFMVNNLSTANIEAKAKEFAEFINEQYYPWFAQYMVMKRASIEPNFHDLYLKFLDKVGSKTLNKEIVKATYENCKVLLRSDLIKSSSEERSLLKNLGSWLGKFTIGRNQTLRAKEIDPKALIIEAYEKGLMIAVIPFTSKVLEPCQSSLAYKPPNPWTMGILGLLVEIYNLPNLKMNLKFDIEVLFKNLGVDMKEVKPTSLLKDRVREVEGNPDFSSKDISVSQAPVIEVSLAVIPAMNQVELQADVNNLSHPASHPNVLAQYASPLHHGSNNTIVEDEKVGPLIMLERVPSAQGLTQVSQSPFSLSQLLTMTPTYESHININPKLIQMSSLLQIHRFTKAALDKAIKDIVLPVVQRSVTIASRTTKELVLKDYAMESDDGAISRAAHLMVGTLAGSLAHVTCKEPLRVALSNHLRNLLQTLNLNGDITDQMVQIITNDNIDLGCAVIEHVASEKAVELIDGEIGPSFAAIRKQREAAGTAYYDAGTYAQGPFARVPEALRPKPGRLSVAQQRVYNDFVRNVWQNQSNQISSVVTAGSPGLVGNSVNSSMTHVYGSSSSQLNSSLYATSQVAPGFSSAQQLDLIQEDSDHGSTQLSVSSNTVGPNDGVIQSAVEISSVLSTFAPTVASPDMPTVEISAVSKDIGAVIQPSPVTPGAERMGSASAEPFLTTGDALDKYQLLARKLEVLISKDAREAEIQGVIAAEVPDIVLRCVSRDEAGLAVAQKVFKSLYDNASSPILIAVHLAILSAIRDVCKLVVNELTNWVIHSDEDHKFNKEIVLGLLRSELLNLAEYNIHLAKLIDGGRNKVATEFAISLVQALVIHEPGVNTSELYNVIDALAKLSMRPGSPESLQQLIEIVQNSTTNATSLAGFTANKDEKAGQSRDKRQVISGRIMTSRDEYNVNESAATDPAGLRDQVSHLFAEWCRICELQTTNDAIYSHYFAQLQQSGFLNGDDITDRFFRILTELSVAHCLAHEQVNMPQSLSFVTIDAYAKLIVLVLKYFSMDQGSNKMFLLTKVLSVTVRIIHKDAEEKKTFFNPRPYFRLFINWLLDLTSDAVLEGSNFQVLTSFAVAFHALQPLKVPGFSFAWLELVSHRSFMPKLITSSALKGWPCFQRLLVDLFKFMEPYLRNAELGEAVQLLYRGTMRVLLVLLHDFPEFLCEYHFSFCDVIPPSCIQMRNVILSAFPRNMRLPDPSTPNLKIDLLAEISQPPRILSDVDGALKAKQLKVDIDEYMKTKPDGSPFLSELNQRLLLPPSEAILAGTRYNAPLINSLVLYVGMQAIQQLQNKSTSPQQMTHNGHLEVFLVSAAMDIFQSLLINLDSEGRYLFLNAVANQLRYPNNHTHYFSFVLLFLFVEASQQEIFQEQITRVLLERLIVNRPHPWGLLITFIELIKNPRYSFRNRSFIRCAPEIEKLFESVSRSCGGPKAVDDGMVAGGIQDGNH